MRRKRWLWLPARAVQNTLLAALIATLSILLSSPDRHYYPAFTPFYAVERAGYDFLFAFRGARQAKIDPRIRVVGFDRASESDLKIRWPAPRRFHADVIRNLAKDGASLIVYDVLFSDGSDPEDDKALDKALKQTGNVVLPIRIDRDYQQKRETLEEPYYNDDLGIDFLDKAKDGFAEVPQDTDDVVRRFTPLMYFQDKPVPALASAAYLKIKGLNSDNLAIKENAIQVGDLMIPRSGPTIRDPFNEAKALIPSAYIDFPAGNAAFSLDVTFSDVALGTFPKGTFQGKIVFVGLTGQEGARENYDRYTTSYTNHSAEGFGSMGYVKDMPGVFLQALNFNALIRNGFITHLPEWAVWVLVFGLTIASAAAVRSSFNWRGPAILILCVLGYILYSIEVFNFWSIHLPWIVPSILMLSSITLVTYFERGALRKKWSGYVSPQVLETILKGEESATAQRCIASVVFGDIRGFTSFTQEHSPEKVVKLLNMHFERMTNIIYDQDGTIDKFLGDGVMALFGVPVSRSDSAICAVRAAWSMCEAAMLPLTLDGESFVLESGFGVTTGTLVAGHLGSKMRHDYTVIGDVVNMASRLQGVTGASDVVMDYETYKLVNRYVSVEPLGLVRVKGSAEPVECFKMTGWLEYPLEEEPREPRWARKKAGIAEPISSLNT